MPALRAPTRGSPLCRMPPAATTGDHPCSYTFHFYTHPRRASHAAPAFCHSHSPRARLPSPRRAPHRRSGMPRPARRRFAAAASHAVAFAVLTLRREGRDLLAARQALRDGRARSSARPPRTRRRPTRAFGGRRARSRRRSTRPRPPRAGAAPRPGHRMVYKMFFCACVRGARRHAPVARARVAAARPPIARPRDHFHFLFTLIPRHQFLPRPPPRGRGAVTPVPLFTPPPAPL